VEIVMDKDQLLEIHVKHVDIKEQSETINIPKGVDNGVNLRVSKKGNQWQPLELDKVLLDLKNIDLFIEMLNDIEMIQKT
jgi:hypothetical protein